MRLFITLALVLLTTAPLRLEAQQTTPLQGRVVDAETGAPLLIENRALGYRVHYYLKDFEVVQGVLRYFGIPRFDELEPRKPKSSRAITNSRARLRGKREPGGWIRET